MAQLIIPIIDDALEERLRTRASRNGRNLDEEVRAILEETARAETPEQGLREEGVPMLGEEKGFGDLMYERFKEYRAQGR